jgi:hypothetical protein
MQALPASTTLLLLLRRRRLPQYKQAAHPHEAQVPRPVRVIEALTVQLRHDISAAGEIDCAI